MSEFDNQGFTHACMEAGRMIRWDMSNANLGLIKQLREMEFVK